MSDKDWKEIAKGAWNKTKETYDQLNDRRQSAKQESTLKLTYKGMLRNDMNMIRKTIDGYYYIGGYQEAPELYAYDYVEFEGSTFTQNTKTKGKTQGRAGSALVGGLVAGPVGAVIGSSRKRKNKSDSVTTTTEKEGKGKLYLRSVVTNQPKEIKFSATQAEFDNIERFFG